MGSGVLRSLCAWLRSFNIREEAIYRGVRIGEVKGEVELAAGSLSTLQFMKLVDAIIDLFFRLRIAVKYRRNTRSCFANTKCEIALTRVPIGVCLAGKQNLNCPQKVSFSRVIRANQRHFTLDWEMLFRFN